MGTERQRKLSIFDSSSQSAPSTLRRQEDFPKYRRRRSMQARRNSKDKDFFVPDDVDEWVLPEYRSLFHHLFLKEEEDSAVGSSSSHGRDHSHSSNSSALQRRRKISPSGSTSSNSSEEDGPLCSFVKSFPSWLKRVLHISENNNEEQQSQDEAARHAWLDEIPIDICDKLRHIHIYV